MELVVLEGGYHGSSMALRQMVAHFDEINAAMIEESFTTGRSNDELDCIEEHVHPHARLIVGWVNIRFLLMGPWSLESSASV